MPEENTYLLMRKIGLRKRSGIPVFSFTTDNLDAEKALESLRSHEQIRVVDVQNKAVVVIYDGSCSVEDARKIIEACLLSHVHHSAV